MVSRYERRRPADRMASEKMSTKKFEHYLQLYSILNLWRVRVFKIRNVQALLNKQEQMPR